MTILALTLIWLLAGLNAAALAACWRWHRLVTQLLLVTEREAAIVSGLTDICQRAGVTITIAPEDDADGDVIIRAHIHSAPTAERRH